MGFGIAGGICLINGLSFIFPDVPTIPVKRRYFRLRRGALGAVFRLQRPDTHLVLSLRDWHPLPDAAGDAFFPRPFFCGMNRVEHALGRVTGWDNLPRYPFLKEQVLGGFFGLCVILFWVGRGHFTLVVKRASVGAEMRTTPESLYLTGQRCGGFWAGLRCWVSCSTRRA